MLILLYTDLLLASTANRWTSIQREKEKEREREIARARDYNKQIQSAKSTTGTSSANTRGVGNNNEMTNSQALLVTNTSENTTTLLPASGLTRELRTTLAHRKSPPLYPSPPTSPRENQERSHNCSNVGNLTNYSSQQSLDSLQNSRGKDGDNTFISIYRRKYSVNPFRRDTGADVLDLRTHNRRRWSHVFPSGQNSSVLSNYYGLNWKSLTQPAILPLFTDYIPSVDNMYKG